MELVTAVWKFYRCVEAKEDLLYRFSAAGPVDWGSNQSTGGVPGALCMKVHRDQSTAVTVQSTGYLPESLAVDWGSDQSTGQVPGAACMSQCTGAVDFCHSAVDWKSTREFRQLTVLHSQLTGYAQIEAISRLVLWTSRLVDRVGFLERVYRRVLTKGTDDWDWLNMFMDV